MRGIGSTSFVWAVMSALVVFLAWLIQSRPLYRIAHDGAGNWRIEWNIDGRRPFYCAVSPQRIHATLDAAAADMESLYEAKKLADREWVPVSVPEVRSRGMNPEETE